MPVYVIGVGPGGEDYVTPVARRHIMDCDLLLGDERLTRLFPRPSRELDLKGDPPAAVQFILAQRTHLKLAVLVSGDPGLYSFLGVLSRYLGEEEYEVIPGVSSVQLAFARIKDSWEDALIVSLHGREEQDLAAAVKGHPKVALLTDSRWPPRKIAQHLWERGIRDREFIICQDLSYPQERVVRTDICGALSLRCPDVVLSSSKEPVEG
ncbi:MAG: precorrin-6y C5,15-methyltransferase (decarboxylating) subunit CbiE, partial [Chloroflexota bacterium]|nr:precorrin-6y C5,15-methyltransferase (decarboxylating) subunit CbiE [Chloroflexota bacterium]